MNARRNFNEWEDTLLGELHKEGVSPAEIARKLERTRQTVYSRMGVLGLIRYNRSHERSIEEMERLMVKTYRSYFTTPLTAPLAYRNGVYRGK